MKTAERARLLLQPALVLLVGGAVVYWAFDRDLTATQRENINPGNVAALIWQHLLITFAVTAIVVAVGVPLGVLVTRPGARLLRPVFVGIANIGQAAPAIGLLVLLFLWTARTGFWIGVLPIALYALLPVLSSTILGLDQVDDALLDAGRGQGMTRTALLTRVELPLAVPYILGGLRTSLVIAVGTATLSFLVNAGGLGILIDTGYKLQDNVTLILGSVLAVCLALLVDWFGGLAEYLLNPKGLR
ncbi:binding--dependent transport system inner membrane component family protein [Mycolicibacterium hassiacum DSM 44199]|uniref:Binding--dependent transport system inner membrane component family protein n=1 Tax=Mycolicibacterium hassiacum (strain DSM 44199 / CIP 105218 / JCM 12690 / 3849) TaxID=1122247 RepID=K5BF02_MYCHD|nr:ABC transporter permease [Mycolicibacterium hassiacum]EKF23467.1 binding--dependent transport system inner membrane component family protein [Mycolicibacterium hassiacum DSM 44199]MBX5485252.1 ABC transporter permease [Mycolicibacterium hassiacum]MDA4084712.1 ABC transporter permease [Mycolicibacterium hassiacum DSM 44199]PZN19065.1 MAG: ABC transporter permease [Mycolicibacterium hassiacum]VCT89933.1 Carnitine transport permease protein OpuCB [Mycolicibacterium hassiacum DSM 44199]